MIMFCVECKYYKMSPAFQSIHIFLQIMELIHRDTELDLWKISAAAVTAVGVANARVEARLMYILWLLAMLNLSCGIAVSALSIAIIKSMETTNCTWHCLVLKVKDFNEQLAIHDCLKIFIHLFIRFFVNADL